MCVAGVFLLKVGWFTRRHMHNFPPCLPLYDARCIHTRQNKIDTMPKFASPPQKKRSTEGF